MTDREQTRRDAVLKCTDLLNSLAAELSKAERDRAEAQGFLSDQIERIRAAEARLEKVPALVEKAKRAKNLAAAPDYDEQGIIEALWDLARSVAALEEP